jgi:hypothetical protein
VARRVAFALIGALAAPAPVSAAPLAVDAIVHPGAHAVSIGWRATAPARVTIEIGRTGEYGVWLRAPAQPRVSGRSLLGGLEPATEYRYRIRAKAEMGSVSRSGVFTTSPFPDWTVGAVIDRTLYVDGQPFFPRMVFHQFDWAYQRSLDVGINLFMGAGAGSPWDQLAAVRGRAVSTIPAAYKGVADGRGTIGWYHPDEADLYVPPEALPFHPPWQQTRRVTFLTLSGRVYSGSALPPGGTRAVYPRFVSRADMVGLDLYPLQTWCRRDALHAVWEAQRELAALAGPRATYQWIEAGRMEFCGGRPSLDPTPATVRAETWLAVAGGARGIGWFPAHWQPAIAAEVARLGVELSALAPALLADEIPVVTRPASPVKAGGRRLNGAVYVVAVNSSFRPAAAAVTVPGLLSGHARVFREARSVPVRNGTIRERFAPLAARIYVVPPPDRGS